MNVIKTLTNEKDHEIVNIINQLFISNDQDIINETRKEITKHIRSRIYGDYEKTILALLNNIQLSDEKKTDKDVQNYHKQDLKVLYDVLCLFELDGFGTTQRSCSKHKLDEILLDEFYEKRELVFSIFTDDLKREYMYKMLNYNSINRYDSKILTEENEEFLMQLVQNFSIDLSKINNCFKKFRKATKLQCFHEMWHSGLDNILFLKKKIKMLELIDDSILQCFYPTHFIHMMSDFYTYCFHVRMLNEEEEYILTILRKREIYCRPSDFKTIITSEHIKLKYINFLFEFEVFDNKDMSEILELCIQHKIYPKFQFVSKYSSILKQIIEKHNVRHYDKLLKIKYTINFLLNDLQNNNMKNIPTYLKYGIKPTNECIKILLDNGRLELMKNWMATFSLTVSDTDIYDFFMTFSKDTKDLYFLLQNEAFMKQNREDIFNLFEKAYSGSTFLLEQLFPIG